MKQAYQKINRHALSMMNLYRQYKLIAGDDQWKELEYRQAYRDALESIKRAGLINEYSLGDFSITTVKNVVLALDINGAGWSQKTESGETVSYKFLNG